ncbi:nuclear transcription factor Y subunit C-3-like [Primulina eburnea]|uniref:nuclear transcription factor Y subunit C-3-like n=1 Tax=Primulina eburnea TaxID=1245227 RepID=UPI003C6C01AC
MEHQGNELPLVGSSAQMAYGANLYQGNPMAITSSQVPTGSTVSAQTAGLSPSPAQMAQQHLAYQQLHQQQQLQQQLQSFWASQIENLDHITDFKNHSLPLARIKKIMKADEDVRMISAEAPVLFARACELFILELTLCAWNHTEENKRRTLQRNDIAAAITRTDIFDFLIDIVPREDLKDEVLASMSAGPVRVGAPAEGVPYYYMPPAPPVGAPGMTVGQPVDPALYGQHPHPYMAQHMWPQEQALPPTDS